MKLASETRLPQTLPVTTIDGKIVIRRIDLEDLDAVVLEA
jgi:hypothetical protein